MDQLQTISGIFDTTAEAQQAVQLLLAEGFTHNTVSVWTPPYSQGQPLTETAKADQRSGRFLTSLFGDRQPGQSESDPSTPGESIGTPTAPGESTPGSMLVVVQTQSVAEARQVTDLLEGAGSLEVTIREGKTS